jgi:TetR/AcrR family transcriptional regulator
VVVEVVSDGRFELSSGWEEFGETEPGHGAINIIDLCGFYFCAANNVSHIPGRIRNPLNRNSLARHTAEVMAFVRKGTSSSS